MRPDSDRAPGPAMILVGTMGPLTCAADALGGFVDRSCGHEATFFPSFEAVRDALSARVIDRALVPHCHPVTTEMLFDPRFEVDVAAGFDKPNPPLHLAAKRGRQLNVQSTLTCASLPLLWPLVATVTQPRMTLVPVVSNPVAARALADGEVDLAVTNDASLLEWDLRSVRLLKHVVVRWFVVRRATPGTVDLSREVGATSMDAQEIRKVRVRS